MQRGVCQLELGNLVAAAGDFGNCIGLWPDFAWGYFNRGCALDRGGKKTEAIEDYRRPSRHDADFLPAYINRGLAQLELKQYNPVLADLDKAAALGRDGPRARGWAEAMALWRGWTTPGSRFRLRAALARAPAS